jgi:hypothetical protein
LRRFAPLHQAHRTIRTALNAALRRGHITRSPASITIGHRSGFGCSNAAAGG